MSQDLRNSMLLWIGALAFFGLFWTTLHFKVFAGIPDQWIWPAIGVVAAVEILGLARDYLRNRKRAAAKNGTPTSTPD